MKTLSTLGLLGALALVVMMMNLSSCNTVKGVGKDIHDSAQNVQVWIEGDRENYQHMPADDPRYARAARP